MFDLVDKIIDSQFEKSRKLVSPADVYNMSNSYMASIGEDAVPSTEQLTGLYKKLTWVFACVRFIATNVAKLPWEVHRKVNRDGDTEIVTDDPRFAVLSKPNPWTTLLDFKIESITRLFLQGEMFWEIQYAGKKIEALFPDWKSNEVSIVGDPDNFIKSFKRMINGKTYTFDLAEVFMMKIFNPDSNLRGMPVLTAGRSASNLDLQSVKYNEQFFKTGLKMGGLIKSKRSLQPEEARRVKNTFAEMYQGNDAMHKIGVLWDDFDFEALNTMSNNDIQFEQLRKMNREEIISIFGLSLEVLGLGEKTYENVKFYRRMAWTETLMPLMDRFLSLLNDQFLPRVVPDFERYIIKTNYKNIEALKEDRSQKVIDYSAGVNLGVLTRNEMRQDVYGKDPVDDDPTMDEFKPQNSGAIQQQDIQDPEKKKSFLNLDGLDVYRMPTKTYEQRTEVWNGLVKRFEKRHQDVFKQAAEQLFSEQKRVIVRNAKDFGKNIKEILQVEGLIYDSEYWERDTANKFGYAVSETVRMAGQDLMSSINAGTIDMQLPMVRAALGERVNRLSRFVNDTTDKNIKQIIQRTLQETSGQNLSVVRAALAKELSQWFDKISPSRIEKIARTESVGAANLGTQVALQQQNVMQNKVWITSRDDKVRDSHKIDGQTVRIDEDFVLANGSQMPYPMDIMERCVHLGTTEGVTEKQRNNDYKEYTDPEKMIEDLKESHYIKTIMEHFGASRYADLPNNGKEMIDAFSSYKGSLYYNINRTLRFGESSNALSDAAITYLDKAYSILKNITLKQNTILWRNGDGLGKSLEITANKINMLKGSYITDHGFCSTTLSREFAEDWDKGFDKVIFRIRANQGTRAVSLDRELSASTEFEYLLPRDTRFKVLDIYKHPKFDPNNSSQYPEFIAELEIVP